MPTELETHLKSAMGYKILAPSCQSCTHRQMKTDGFGEASHTCTLSPVLSIIITPQGVCKHYEEVEVPF